MQCAVIMTTDVVLSRFTASKMLDSFKTSINVSLTKDVENSYYILIIYKAIGILY